MLEYKITVHCILYLIAKNVEWIICNHSLCEPPFFRVFGDSCLWRSWPFIIMMILRYSNNLSHLSTVICRLYWGLRSIAFCKIKALDSPKAMLVSNSVLLFLTFHSILRKYVDDLIGNYLHMYSAKEKKKLKSKIFFRIWNRLQMCFCNAFIIYL